MVVLARPGWPGWAYLASRDRGADLFGDAGRLILVPNQWVAGTVALEVKFPTQLETAAALAPGSVPNYFGTKTFLVPDVFISGTSRLRGHRSDLSARFQQAASWGLRVRPAPLALGNCKQYIQVGLPQNHCVDGPCFAGAIKEVLFGPVGAIGSAAHFALDGDFEWTPTKQCETTDGGTEPWWQVSFQHPQLVAEVLVYFPIRGSEYHVNVLEPLIKKGVWALFGDAQTSSFRAVSHGDPASGSITLARLQADAVFAKKLNGNHCSVVNSTQTDSVLMLLECRVTMERPTGPVSFLGIHLECSGCSLKLSEVLIIGAPINKFHPLFFARTALSASNNDELADCDIDLLKTCPGSKSLVSCLGNPQRFGGICSCFTEAMKCFDGRQKNCPGESVIVAESRKNTCPEDVQHSPELGFKESGALLHPKGFAARTASTIGPDPVKAS